MFMIQIDDMRLPKYLMFGELVGSVDTAGMQGKSEEEEAKYSTV